MHIQKDQYESVLYNIMPINGSKYSLYISFSQMGLFAELHVKLCSEIVWHRFFAVPAFIRRFRPYIAVRKLFLNTSPNFSSRFRGSACFWQSPDILRKIRKIINALTD